ncbi:MAG: hypothetical protein H8E46_00085 [FCB group bacterium]|nr:hypothetical protein [FCB group bacterium]
MRRLIALTLLSALTLSAFAQTGSQVLYRGTGDITGAVLTENGLIIGKETTAEIVATDIFGSPPRSEIPLPAENQRVFFSPNGRFAVLADYTGQGDYFEIPQFRVTELASGNEIVITGVPGLSGIFVSDRGTVIGVIRNINLADKSELLFYSAEGILLKTIPFPAVTQVKFSPDGGFAGAISGSRGLVIFTATGEEVIELGPCQWFDLAASADGIACAYSNGSSIGVFNQGNSSGRWENQFGTEIFRDVAVSHNAMEIIAVSKHHLYYLDGSGGIIREVHLDAPRSFTTCALGENISGRKFAAYGWETDAGRSVHYTQRHTHGGFTLIENPGADGAQEITEELNYANWNVFTPDVKFSSRGLLIQTMDEIRYLQLNEER